MKKSAVPELTEPEAIRYREAINDLVRRAKAYGKKAKRTRQQVSKDLFGNVNRLDALESENSSLLPCTYDAACKKLAEAEAKLAEARAA